MDVESRDAELEEVSDALLLTASDDFNALAAYELRQELGAGRVYRLPPSEGGSEPAPAYAEGALLFAEGLTFGELSRHFEAGARIVERRVEGDSDTGPEGEDLTPLFLVSGSGDLRVGTAGAPLDASTGDTIICLADNEVA